mmetsp:Transcript_11141/g.31331  ORF Transcript_11141/g.31331 Transcript_11141/m.31331 type:complete len:219 (-) Transcript_11141:366-1022(-)
MDAPAIARDRQEALPVRTHARLQQLRGREEGHLEGLLALTCRHVPHLRREVVGAGNKSPPIRREGRAVQRLAVALQHVPALAATHVPEPRGAVRRAGREDPGRKRTRRLCNSPCCCPGYGCSLDGLQLGNFTVLLAPLGWLPWTLPSGCWPILTGLQASFVRSLDLLEDILAALAEGLVRVVQERELAEGALDLLLRGPRRHPQNLIPNALRIEDPLG